MKLPRFFHREKLSELDIKLKKYPRKDRKRLKELYLEYKSGKVLIPSKQHG